MKKVRISKQAYLRLDGEKLVHYAQNLIAQSESRPEFAFVQAQLDAVKTAVVELDAILPEAVNGGRDRTTLKKHAIAALIDKLDLLVDAVELARLPAETMEKAGFGLLSVRRSHAGTEIATPLLQAAAQLGDGAIELRFALPDTARVQTNAFAWSADGGATWQYGAYGKRSPYKLLGLPPRHDVLIRMCSLGTHGRASAWSPPIGVFVL
jgi:hypothetical protein